MRVFTAMFVLAPGLFSMITGWPRFADSCCPRVRATTSTAPPGGKPTSMRIGFDGYGASAAAAMPASDSSTTQARGRRSFIVSNPFFNARCGARYASSLYRGLCRATDASPRRSTTHDAVGAHPSRERLQVRVPRRAALRDAEREVFEAPAARKDPRTGKSVAQLEENRLVRAERVQPALGKQPARVLQRSDRHERGIVQLARELGLGAAALAHTDAHARAIDGCRGGNARSRGHQETLLDLEDRRAEVADAPALPGRIRQHDIHLPCLHRVEKLRVVGIDRRLEADAEALGELPADVVGHAARLAARRGRDERRGASRIEADTEL